MEYIENWEKTKARFEAFWHGEVIDRCMIAVFAPKKNSHYKSFRFPQSKDEQERYWLDGEAVLERNLDYFQNTYFGGDALAQVFLNTGTAGHAGFFKNAGCSFSANTVWYEPFIKDIKKDVILFDGDSFLFKKMMELAKYFVSESKGRYFVSMPDTCGNADALAHLRGSENLLVDMLEEKQWVKASLDKIQKAWTISSNEVYEIIEKNNFGGSTIGWLNTWAPCRHGQMQSDISVMLSPDLYKEFIIPELECQTQWYDKSLYHFDGIEQIRHLDFLLSMEKLHAIQWTHVEGQPSPLEYIPYLRKIQKAGKNVIIIAKSNEILEGLMEHLSSKGLLLIAYASSEDEAKEIIKKVERLTHE